MNAAPVSKLPILHSCVMTTIWVDTFPEGGHDTLNAASSLRRCIMPTNQHDTLGHHAILKEPNYLNSYSSGDLAIAEHVCIDRLRPSDSVYRVFFFSNGGV